MKCVIVPNCPKGISRKDLVEIAKICNIPGSENNYKSPYRNMHWLCTEIDKITIQKDNEKIDKKIIKPSKQVVEKKSKDDQPKISAEERKKIMKDYEEHWIKEFGVDPNQAEFAQLGKERYIRAQGGVEGLQMKRLAEFEADMAEIIPERMAKKIQIQLREEILCKPCANLSLDEEAILFAVDPIRVIRLKVEKDDVSHCLCYDVQKLYENLKETYGARDAELANWTDPTLGIKYSSAQVKRIKHNWAISRPDSPARVHLENRLQMSRIKK